MLSLSQSTLPFDRLANELLSEIFIHYRGESPPLRGIESPTSLLGICRRWRSIALHTPQLWAHIHVVGEPSRLPPHALRTAEIVQIWMERSASCPLYLSLNAIYVPDVFPLALSQRHRWAVADFRLSVDQVRLMAEQERSESPHLVVLRLGAAIEGNPGLPEVRLGDAPLLRTVRLWNTLWTGSDGLPWAQLTTLTLFRTPLGRCIPLIPLLERLVRLKLMVRDARGESGIGQSEAASAAVGLSLTSLETLVLAASPGIPADSALAFFTDLALPSLEKLEIPQVVNLPIAVAALVQRSRCSESLRTIRVTTSRHDPDPDATASVQALRNAFPQTSVLLSYSWMHAFDDEVWKQQDWVADSDSE